MREARRRGRGEKRHEALRLFHGLPKKLFDVHDETIGSWVVGESNRLEHAGAHFGCMDAELRQAGEERRAGADDILSAEEAPAETDEVSRVATGESAARMSGISSWREPR